MAIQTEKINTSWENLLQIFKYSKSSNKYQIQDYRKKRNFLEFIKTQTFDEDTRAPKNKISFKTREVFDSYFSPFLNKKDSKNNSENSETSDQDTENQNNSENKSPKQNLNETEASKIRLEEIKNDSRIWEIDLISIRKFERKSRRNLKQYPHDSNAVIFLKRIKTPPQETEKTKPKAKKRPSRTRKKKTPEPVKAKEEWEISSESDCFWIDLAESEPEVQNSLSNIKNLNQKKKIGNYKEPLTGKEYFSKKEGWQISLNNYKEVKKEIVDRIKINRELKTILEDEKIVKKKRRKVNRKKEKKVKDATENKKKVNSEKSQINSENEIKELIPQVKQNPNNKNLESEKNQNPKNQSEQKSILKNILPVIPEIREAQDSSQNKKIEVSNQTEKSVTNSKNIERAITSNPKTEINPKNSQTEIKVKEKIINPPHSKLNTKKKSDEDRESQKKENPNIKK